MADYIDRQAAIAALDKFAEDSRGSGAAGVAFAMAAMAKSVISGLPSPWVSVEDKSKLPLRGSGAIIAARYDTGRIVFSSWRDGSGEWVGVPRGGTVTHWMPLPDAPEVGTK